jgi:acetolactate synthase I/II/III large subunit
LIDLPMDIQRAEIVARRTSRCVPPAANAVDADAIAEVLDRLATAERPLILAGGGIRTARAVDLFRILTAKVKVPVVNSLMAVDVLPGDDPVRVGMIGTYGNRWANLAIDRSDFLLVLGSRLDIRQTGADVGAFKGERGIYHLDCDAAEINNRVTGCRSVLGDLNSLLGAAVSISLNRNFPERPTWKAEIANLRSNWPDTKELRGLPGINPNEFVHQLIQASQNAAAVVVDVGQHQMWAAQSAELGPDQRFLTSGGMGAMGFALPAAMGAAFASAPSPVVVISGDGGFQLNMQELETIAHHKLPIKIVILNNKCYGMIRQFQESYFQGRYQSSLWGYSSPDFVRISRAYDIPARSIGRLEEVDETLRWLWHAPNTPCLLDVQIDTHANAYPKIAFGRPMTEMEPFPKPVSHEGT